MGILPASERFGLMVRQQGNVTHKWVNLMLTGPHPILCITTELSYFGFKRLVEHSGVHPELAGVLAGSK